MLLTMVILNRIKYLQIYIHHQIFLAPSLSDNLPLSIMESISCGTPVVAFNSGGIKDLIWHKRMVI